MNILTEIWKIFGGYQPPAEDRELMENVRDRLALMGGLVPEGTIRSIPGAIVQVRRPMGTPIYEVYTAPDRHGVGWIVDGKINYSR